MIVKHARILLTGSLMWCSVNLFGQNDSIVLPEVPVTVYPGVKPQWTACNSVARIDSGLLGKQPGQSLVPAINSIAGVRMEERSPGSYRLSIRGSLLRSPFGVRNIKIYLDDLPFTNAGGETYLNLIDQNSISSLEIVKGPDGSMFGANTGGVVKINSVNLRDTNSFIMLSGGGGSFGLKQQFFKIQQKVGRSVFHIHQGWQQSTGFRKNSAMDRKYIQLSDQLSYLDKGQLRLFFFLSDLNYQTPGGLTYTQFKNDPSMARPATATMPGAEDQKAGIHNRTFFGGITNEVKIGNGIKHLISFFGSSTDFKNPFITNFETRKENNFGSRTWLEFKNDPDDGISFTWSIGAEEQSMISRIANYGNRGGTTDTVQAKDKAMASYGFLFTNGVINFYNRINIEASISYNSGRYGFLREHPVTTRIYNRTFDPVFMPKVACSYLANNFICIRGTISKGFSAPTLQEIRSADNSINQDLQPEEGWNYEAGLRLRTKKQRLWWDISGFYYCLNKAIVKRVNVAGQEYFVNAGRTSQPGVESQLNLTIVKQKTEGFFRALTFTQATTLNFFIFNDYRSETANYSGNAITGVPGQVFVSSVSIDLPAGFFLFLQHNHTSTLPLNDAGSAHADSYELMQATAAVKFGIKKVRFEFRCGVDNLFNQTYSLGNDLNAAAGRYYNPAPPRNYFAKLVALLP